MKRELKNGLYRHFKKGVLYVVYDLTTSEVNMNEQVSYVRLSDGRKFNRDTDTWFDDVSQREDNETGQKSRYKLLDTEVTFYCNAVFEKGPSLKEFLKLNNIPLSIELGDKVLLPTLNNGVQADSSLTSWTITGITDDGVYLGTGVAKHVFAGWYHIKAFVKNFK